MDTGVLNRHPSRVWLLVLCLLVAPSYARQETKPVGSDALSSMEAFSWTLLQVKQDYVDPTRIRPEAMMHRTFEYMERRVPELKVNLNDGVAKVQVGPHHETFTVGKPATIWEMNYNLQPIFKFIGSHLEPDQDPKEVEIAAINGMLSTLDPHSNLLPPELYREMQLKTTGEFGGLGIRISIRKGALTVISPLPETPAARVGLKALDQIVRINDQSTVNMPLDEAVNLLRGTPGSQVSIWIMRTGWSEPHAYVMTRETIRVRSIESKLLDHQIGYIQIQDFGAHTAADLLRHLNDLKNEGKGLKGLILDVRNNAGGLLKAAIQVADMFLDKGTIVATVSYSEDSTPEKLIQKSREEQRADEDVVDPKLPIVVLTNSGSASASEILAGALKNLDRAVLMGEQTFGKGSVQILNERVPPSIEGACLKLTVAEYLIPGDISIQEVGVTPDIRLTPLVLDKDTIQIFAEPARFREEDIPAHLKVQNARVFQPSQVVQYLYDGPKPTVGTEDEPPIEEPGFKEDFEIRLAKEFLQQVKSISATAMLDEGSAFLRTVQQAEQRKLEERMATFSVDWSKGTSAGGQGTVNFTLSGDGVAKDGSALADHNVHLVLTVKNTGQGPFHRLRAESKSKHALFDRREFIFGRVDPGTSKSFEVPIKIPRGVSSRTDDLRFTFFCEEGQPPPPYETRITTRELPEPVFGFSYRILDPEGNGDGLIEPGEKIDLDLTVTNIGAGKSFDTKALLKNSAGKDLFLEAGRGRITLQDIPPGQARHESFGFQVLESCTKDKLPVEVTIWDSDLGASAVAEIELPVIHGKAPTPAKIVSGLEVKRTRAEVRGGANAGAPLVGFAPKGARFTSDRVLGTWYRIQGPAAPLGWINRDAATTIPAAKVKATTKLLEPFIQYTPPQFSIENLPAYLEKGTSVTLRGKVTDEDQDLREVAIWVGTEKVFLQPGIAGNARKIPLEVPLSLNPGPNLITVIAREGSKLSAQKSFVVTRPGGLDWKKPSDWMEDEDPSQAMD